VHAGPQVGQLVVMLELPVQVPRSMIGTDGFQETPIVEVTRQITKHNYLVLDLNDLPRIMKEVRTSAGHASPLGPACVLRAGITRARYMQKT